MNNPIDVLIKYVGSNYNKVLDAWKEKMSDGLIISPTKYICI